MAENQGFEPWRRITDLIAFQAIPFSHLGNSPLYLNRLFIKLHLPLLLSIPDIPFITKDSRSSFLLHSKLYRAGFVAPTIFNLASLRQFECPTCNLGGCCSIQLSYKDIKRETSFVSLIFKWCSVENLNLWPPV